MDFNKVVRNVTERAVEAQVWLGRASTAVDKWAAEVDKVLEDVVDVLSDFVDAEEFAAPPKEDTDLADMKEYLVKGYKEAFGVVLTDSHLNRFSDEEIKTVYDNFVAWESSKK